MTNIDLHYLGREKKYPKGDIVFVHGLGSDSLSAWTNEDSSGKRGNEKEWVSYFPEVLASDFPECNTWALDYSAPITNWLENKPFNELTRHSNNIVNYLLGKGIGTRPIVFICHSLGGIVIKEVLRVSSQSTASRIQKIFKQTKSVSFISTPHSGSEWATILGSVNKVLPFVRTADRIKELAHDNEYLENLGNWYRKISSDGEIETQAFFEQKKIGMNFVVSHLSANPQVAGCSLIGINRNHLEIARPAKKSDELYVSLCGLINHHLLGEQSYRGMETAQNSIPPQTIVIGVLIKGDKVLMVRRRNPIDKLTWQFVAGRLKVGQESPEECIIRETREETGIAVSVREKLAERTDGTVPYKRIYFSLQYIDGKPENLDPAENAEAKWIKINAVEDAITTKIDESVKQYLGI